MSALSFQIRLETPADARDVEALNVDSFGPGRFAKSAYRLREGSAVVPGLSFVATDDNALRGSVRFWPLRIGQNKALLLGPLAVDARQRGRGIGIALMQAGIDAARAQGWRSILLVGDEPYYARVGFSRLPQGRVIFPGPVDASRILGLSLSANALLDLSGQVRPLLAPFETPGQ